MTQKVTDKKAIKMGVTVLVFAGREILKYFNKIDLDLAL